MLYNVTKVYVLNSQVLYVDEGEISRDSSNFNQIDVITNVTGFSAEIAFKLPNSVFSNRIGLIQQTGTVTVPSNITELQSVAGQSWSTYTMFIDNAVLSAITSTTSQTLEFSVRFTNQITNLLVFDELSDFPTVGEGDKVYQADNTGQYYVWNGVNYVTKTQQEANALIVNEGQVYTTEPSFLSIQGTIGGDPLALDPAFYQNQIVSSFNNLVALYNSINNAITDSTTGLNSKVNRSGDTMTGALAFSAGQQSGVTRLNMNNNKVVTTDGINATTFDNGDKDSDAIKFSDLAQLFTVDSVTPTGGDNWLDTFTAELTNKFASILSENDLSGIFLRRDGTVAMTGGLNMGGQNITNIDGIADLKTAVTGKVDKTTTIAGIDLQNNITQQEVKDAIGLATTSLSGLLSAADKTSLDNLVALLATDDADTVVNTIGEVLAIFAQYPEGADLVTALSNKSDVGHTHTESEITDLDKYTQQEVDTFLANKMDIDGTNSALTELTFDDGVTQSTITYDHDKKVLQVTNGATLTINGDLVFAGGKAVGSIALGDVVQFAGSQGNHYLVKKAVGSEIAVQPELILGIAHEAAANNDYLRVAWFGEVKGLNLSANQLGDILYFNTTTSELTTTRPTTDPIIQLAAVVNNANNGTLLVRPKFISRKAQEIFVQAITNKFGADNVQNLLEELYDKTQAHEDDTTNPHSVTATQVGAYTTSETDTLLSGKSDVGHTHTESDITDLDKYTQSQVDTFLSGKADLVNGLIPVSQIPFQFDDVLQGYIDQGVFYEEATYVTVIPAAEGKLYIDIATNDIYRYDGSAYVIVKEAVGALGDIPDVTITSVQTDDVLKYNGSVWVNGVLDINELSDVVITNIADGQYLKYDNATGKWTNTELDVPTIDSLDAIDDVDAANAAQGDILQYNASTSQWELNRINFVSDTAPASPNVGDFWFDSSTLVLYVYYDDGDSIQWVNAVSGIVEGQPEELNDLTDVTLGTLANGEVLTYNSSTQVFENQALPAETGLANVVYLTTTIATGDWSGTDPVTAVKTVSGVLSTDKPLIDIDLSAVAFADVEDKQTEYAKIYRVAATDANEVSFYALEAPTEELVIQIKVVR